MVYKTHAGWREESGGRPKYSLAIASAAEPSSRAPDAGGATAGTAVAALVQPAARAHTDPPYGVNYDPAWRKRAGVLASIAGPQPAKISKILIGDSRCRDRRGGFEAPG